MSAATLWGRFTEFGQPGAKIGELVSTAVVSKSTVYCAPSSCWWPQMSLVIVNVKYILIPYFVNKLVS